MIKRLLALVLMTCASSAAAADHPVLIEHIKTTDAVFSRLLGACHAEHINRSKHRSFTYLGTCQIEPLPQTDCQSYRVTASGTIDNRAWATVRDIRLSLECTA